MTTVLSNLLWIPKTSLSFSDLELLRKKYTLIGKSTYNEIPPVLKVFAETPEYFGAPREERAKYVHEDKTAYRRIGWPSMKFPVGGGWREGQQESFNNLVEYFNDPGNYGGRLDAKCSSGKTLLALALAQSLGARTLVLTHKADIGANWFSDASDFFPGTVLGKVQGDTWNYVDAHVTVALVQTLWARRANLPKGFTSAFDLVIVDEGHRFSAETFAYVFKIFSARYRLGVSATWRRRDGLERAWDYHIGPIIHKHKAVVRTGKYIQYDLPIDLSSKTYRQPWARCLNILAQCSSYNEWVAKEVARASKADRKILVLSDRVDQLIYLQSRILQETDNLGYEKMVGLYVGAIAGKIVKKEQLQAAKSCNIILATFQMMMEGVDVPDLDTLFLISPRSDIEQCVGRIQRYHPDKKSLLVVDPTVRGCRMFDGTARKRLTQYKAMGFTEMTAGKGL